VKNSIKLFVYLWVFSFFCTTIILGQDPPTKKIPKPKPLRNLPTTQDSAKKAEKEKLELPDVLILGKDTAIRKPSDKFISSRLAAINLKQINIEREKSLPSTYNSPEQTPEFEPLEKSYGTGLEVRFGTYSSALIKINHWQEFKKLKINFDSDYDRSDGQYDNSQYEKWRVALLGEYQLSPTHWFVINGGLKDNKFGLWADKNHKRKLTQYNFGLGFKGKFSPKFGYSILLDQNKIPLQKDIEVDPKIKNITLNRERNRDIQGLLFYESNEWNFQLKGNVLTNKYNKYVSGLLVDSTLSDPLSSTKNSFTSVELSAGRQLGAKGTLTFGAVYEYYKLDEFDSTANRVNPYLKLNYNLTPSVQIFTSYQPKWRFVTHRELFNFNPFYYSGSGHYPIEDHRHSIDIGAEWKLPQNSVVRLTYQFRSIKNFLIWDSSFESWMATVTPENLFQIRGLEKVHLSILKADFFIGNLKPFQIRSSISFLNSGIDELGPNQPLPQLTNDIPYLEDVSWPTEFNYQFQKDWTLSLIANYFGSRAFSLYIPEKGESIWLLNAKLNYHTNGLNFYLLGRNLLNQKYRIWQDYPETGSQFYIGVEAKF